MVPRTYVRSKRAQGRAARPAWCFVLGLSVPSHAGSQGSSKCIGQGSSKWVLLELGLRIPVAQIHPWDWPVELRWGGFSGFNASKVSIQSLELTWKTIFHYKQVVFHFHVSSRMFQVRRWLDPQTHPNRHVVGACWSPGRVRFPRHWPSICPAGFVGLCLDHFHCCARPGIADQRLR